MQKINTALERLQQAVSAVGGVHDVARAKQVALDKTQIEAAHLRAEISSLKKQNQKLQTDCKRAARRVEKALARIDDVLGEPPSPPLQIAPKH